MVAIENVTLAERRRLAHCLGELAFRRRMASRAEAAQPTDLLPHHAPWFRFATGISWTRHQESA
jgi:hypothetical protein